MTTTEPLHLALAHAHPRYLGDLRRALLARARTGLPFTAEDVRADVTTHPDGGANVLPALMGSMTRRGVIVRNGDTTSRRPSRHGARVGVYIGVTR